MFIFLRFYCWFLCVSFCQCHFLQTTHHSRSHCRLLNLLFHSCCFPLSLGSTHSALPAHFFTSLVHCPSLWMVFPLIHLIHYLCSLQLDRFVCLPLLHTCILSYFTDDHSCYPVPTPYLYMIFQARQMSGSINKTSLASKTVDRYPRLFCEGVTLGN